MTNLPSSWATRVVIFTIMCVSVAATAIPLAAATPTAAQAARLEKLARDLNALLNSHEESAIGDAVKSDPAAPPRTTEERIAELEAQIRILARQIEIDKEQAAERARQTPQSSAGRGGFSIQSADGNFRLRLRGLLHSDSRFVLEDSSQRSVDSFYLRRVRPIAEATLYKHFDVRMMPDFGMGTTTLQDAYVDARFRRSLIIRAGKFKAPVGLERLMSAADLTFIERAFPTLLVPNRDVGIMAHGDLGAGGLAYAAGLFNGVPDGGSADADTQDGKDVVMRLFAQPFRERRDSVWHGLGAGVAATYGSHRGASAAASGLSTLRTSGTQAFFAYRGDDPIAGPVLADGRHVRLSAQGHYYYGRLGLLGEHVLSTQRVRLSTSEATLDNTAWQLAGSWVLTGETPSYRGVAPLSPFDPNAGQWGAFEVTLRYSALAIDRDTFPVFANAASASHGASSWAAGLNWILNSGVKFQVNYERTWFQSAGPVRRPVEHDLLTRVQLAF